MKSSWQGNLSLVYHHRQGKTWPEVLAIAPLKVQRPFYPGGEAICHSVILHTAGGIVGGDLLKQNIRVEPQAQALITTASAGKVYRSDGRLAQQTAEIQLEADAGLQWLPQETIIFNGADFWQTLRVNLAPTAYWLGWEIVRFGRTARAEIFDRGNWRSHTEIWQGETPLWIDRQWLPGSQEIFDSPHGLGGNPVVGSLIWLGKPVSATLIAQVRQIWQEQPRQGQGGVTQTLAQGLLCRYRGPSSAEARQWFVAVCELINQELLRQAFVKPRVWL